MLLQHVGNIFSDHHIDTPKKSFPVLEQPLMDAKSSVSAARLLVTLLEPVRSKWEAINDGNKNDMISVKLKLEVDVI